MNFHADMTFSFDAILDVRHYFTYDSFPAFEEFGKIAKCNSHPNLRKRVVRAVLSGESCRSEASRFGVRLSSPIRVPASPSIGRIGWRLNSE